MMFGNLRMACSLRLTKSREPRLRSSMVFSWTIGTNPRRQLFGICGEVAIRGELFLYSWGRSTMKLESCIVKVLGFNLFNLDPHSLRIILLICFVSYTTIYS